MIVIYIYFIVTRDDRHAHDHKCRRRRRRRKRIL